VGFRRVVSVAAVAVWLQLQLCVFRRDPVESSHTTGGAFQVMNPPSGTPLPQGGQGYRGQPLCCPLPPTVPLSPLAEVLQRSLLSPLLAWGP
jgi:hypothetical protein